MSLTTRQPLLPCGKRYATEDEALGSKRGRSGNYLAVGCPAICQGWHLRHKPVTAGITRQPAAAGTGPGAATRALVLARDGYACVDCGASVIGQVFDLQHRDSRGMGGTSDPASNSPANLLTMLRTCHRRVERRGAHDNAKGYWLKMGEHPLLVPVMYFSPDGSGVSMYLDDEGGISPDVPAGAGGAA